MLFSETWLKDWTHLGEEEQIELEVGRSPLIAHELLLKKFYNCFVSSSSSAVNMNMTSQRKTLENNSRKLRRLLRKPRSQLDRLVLYTTFYNSCSGLISPCLSVAAHHIFWTGYSEASEGVLIQKAHFLVHNNELGSICILPKSLVNGQLLNPGLDRRGRF